MTWKSVVRDFVPPIVMKALRPTPIIVDANNVYASAHATIAAARTAGLSVGDYVERLWGEQGRSASIVERLKSLGAISSATKHIVEIGAGTGRYIEHTLKLCRPNRYQSYEVDQAWSAWLAKTYPIEACASDGKSLRSTKSNSSDLIHAHGVFVYLPLPVSFSYFKEIVRAAAPGAFLAFDIISEGCLDPQTIEKWIESGHDFPRFLSSDYVIRFFEDRDFCLVDRFFWPLNVGKSEYLIFRSIGG
jgi:Methyltransferase domain